MSIVCLQLSKDENGGAWFTLYLLEALELFVRP